MKNSLLRILRGTLLIVGIALISQAVSDEGVQPILSIIGGMSAMFSQTLGAFED